MWLVQQIWGKYPMGAPGVAVYGGENDLGCMSNLMMKFCGALVK